MPGAAIIDPDHPIERLRPTRTTITTAPWSS